MTTLYSYTSTPHTPTPQPQSVPQTPTTRTNPPSLPGTPLSGISTVAIKDGHEGSRHSTHSGEYFATSGDRLARLGGFPGKDSTCNGVEQATYFEMVSGWKKGLEDQELGSRGGTPFRSGIKEGDAQGDDGASETHSTCSTPITITTMTTATSYSSPVSTANSGNVGARKPAAPGQISLPPPVPPATPKRGASSIYSPMVPNPPCPTPNTPSIVPPQATVPSTMPQAFLNRGPKLLNPIYQGISTAEAGGGTPYNTPTSNLNTPPPIAYSPASTPLSAPSPASTVTTSSSIQREQVKAKMVDGMTYDEGVVDTTMRSPLPVDVRSGGCDGTIEEMDWVESAEVKATTGGRWKMKDNKEKGGKDSASARETALLLASNMPGYFSEGNS